MNKAFEKILERLEELKKHYHKCCLVDYNEGAEVALTEAMLIVQEVAEEYNSGWIPLEQGIPPLDTYILLSFFNFSLPVIGRYEEDEEGNGNFYAGDEDETLLSQDMYVNEWQPLPEPFKDN